MKRARLMDPTLRRVEIGGNQGRDSEGCRRITELVLRSLWRDTWPLFALFGTWLILGALFA